eukprot:9478878-Alexandrium_andersonii.AAC.1
MKRLCISPSLLKLPHTAATPKRQLVPGGAFAKKTPCCNNALKHCRGQTRRGSKHEAKHRPTHQPTHCT